jgi:hypothetical protein
MRLELLHDAAAVEQIAELAAFVSLRNQCPF